MLKGGRLSLGALLGYVGVLFFLFTTFIPIDEGIWNYIVNSLAGIAVGFGIFTSTGEYTPLTKEVFMEKLSSPVVWVQVGVLLVYLATVIFGQNVADTMDRIIGCIINLFFGVGVYNDPNSRETL
jgi:uncharacterized membrane protein